MHLPSPSELAHERGHKCPILRVAPTGIAAFNIHGSTLHKSLFTPVRGKFNLGSQQLLLLQGNMKHIHYIVLDEKSMVGGKPLSKVDFRLREACPNKRNSYFGSYSLFMLGDFGQLPPVSDLPLFDLRPREGSSDNVLDANNGRDAYMSLSESITLNRIMRQQGESELARRFREILDHMRHDVVSNEDVDLLNTRVYANLSPDEKAEYTDALCLCPTNALVDQINLNRLASSNKPVLIVPALHTGPGAAKQSEDDAEGLEAKLLLMEGAKVMLTRNLWTSQGLTNGTMGVIRINPLHLQSFVNV